MSSQHALQIGLNILEGGGAGGGLERERERMHISAQHEQEEGEIHSSRIRAQSAAQLESLIHLSTSLVKDLESSQSYLSKGFCRQSSWNVVPAPTLSTP